VNRSLSAAGIALGLIAAIAVCFWVIAVRPVFGGDWPGAVSVSPRVLPQNIPSRFDYPYRGQLTVHTIKHERQMEFYCGKPTPGYFKAGCAIVRPDECIVYILDAEPREFRMTAAQQAATLRHEIAHCNGWKHEEDER